ncbi:hypothetical protein KI387_023516, partial [Taxus chinensis]
MDSDSPQNVGEVAGPGENGIIEGQDANRNIEGAVKVKIETDEMEIEKNDRSPDECNEMGAMDSHDVDFLDNALGKAEDFIPPSPTEWTDYECTSADDLLDAARIFDCVNLPSLGELQYNLQPPVAAQVATGGSSSFGSSTSSSSASVSSPSSSSWMNPNNIKSEEAIERHCHSSSTPSIDQDSATSTSYQSCMVGPFQHQPAETQNKDFLYSDPDLADKIDVLEELQNLDLLDGSDVWDPFSTGGLDGFPSASFTDEDTSCEELPMVFFEWLKSNRESISPEDLRSIKLKRSTIELAAKQLGGGKRAMLHLLKLILAWVQNNHLQRKRKLSQQHQGFNGCRPSFFIDQYNPCYNGGGGIMDHGFEPQNCYAQVPISTEPSMFATLNNNSFNPPAPSPSPAPASSMDAIHHPSKYRRVPLDECGGFTSPRDCQPMIQALDGGAAWPQMNTILPNQIQYEKYCFAPATSSQPHLDYLNYRSTTPAVSTKEARKNRMARQRRSMAHNHHHHQNRHWPSSTTPLSRQSSEQVNISIMQFQQQRQTYLQTDHRRQSWKPEKNLKFLLQKVLKQSDVGNLGRIVLPKKEAETHLPELEARDGISIAMEDIVTSRVWNMRYRFWPNNKSRMYLLENTGDFVRSNGLQEGDFIVIYSDTKTGKY